MTFFNGQGYLDFGAPAQRHSEPSISAAIGQTRAKRDTDRQRILDALERLGPLTDEQIGKAAGIGMNTVRPRRVELVRDGLVVAVDHEGRTDSGSKATRWGVATT
jgi:predicted ArsR family transcriptional regulator